MKFNDLTGKKFGHWTVISRAENVNHHTVWNCVCDCGTLKPVYASHLVKWTSPSCGCITRSNVWKINFSHGMSKERIYSIWAGIKGRCYNKNTSNYYLYGARGIKMCDLWKEDFMSFYNWSMDNGYNESLTIDRIDGDGDYCPENCRWATKKQQSNNTKRTIKVDYYGDKMSIKELSEKENVSYNVLWNLIRNKNISAIDAIKIIKERKE